MKGEVVQKLLQEEHSDYWHIKEKKGVIECYFINTYRFSVFRDDEGDWCISGTELRLDIIKDLINVLNAA